MTKVEILKREKEKQQERCDKFLNFIRNTDFIETTDKVGNFGLNLPLFYKKVSENTFLAFSIPTFKNVKKYGFHADFWKIIAESENEFLINRVESRNLIDLRLSFDLESDIEIFETELSKYQS